MKRNLLYIKNAFVRPTGRKTVLYGVHFTEKNHLAVTLRFPDQHCYQLVRQKRSGIRNVLDSNGHVPFRCSNFRCKVKARLIPRDASLLENCELNREMIISPDFWEMGEHPSTIHTCTEGQATRVAAYHSDRMKFGYDFRKNRSELGCTSRAWDVTVKKYETGLGIQFDSLIVQSRQAHEGKLSYDRKRKAAPTNQNVRSSKNLEVAEEFQTIR